MPFTNNVHLHTGYIESADPRSYKVRIHAKYTQIVVRFFFGEQFTSGGSSIRRCVRAVEARFHYREIPKPEAMKCQ